MPANRLPIRRLPYRLAAALGLFVVIAVAWILSDRDADRTRTDSAAAPVDDSTRERSALVRNADGERLPPGAEHTRKVPAFERRVTGRVVDAAGRPAAGARLALAVEGFGEREFGACDSDGAFDATVEIDRVPAELVLSPPWSLAAAVSLDEKPWGPARTLVATRRLTLSGSVVDDDGLPVAAMRVAWRLAEREGPPGGDTHTDAEGRFGLAGAVALPGLELTTTSVRYEPTVVAVADLPPDAGAAADVPDVVLRVHAVPESLIGRVLDDAGEPVEARLALGSRTTRSDAQTGEFALDLRWYAPEEDPLVAAAQGYAPAVLEDVGREFERLGRRHPALAIVLQPAGVVTGHVLTHDGRPAVGARVSLRDAAPLYDVYAEQLASASGELTREVGTDGAFTLDGLERGRLTVIAVDPDSLAYVEREVEPGAADTPAEIELRLLPPDERRTVRGALRFRDGSPAGGISIAAYVELPGQPLRDHRFTRTTSVAADGTFVLSDLPRQDLTVSLTAFFYPRETPLPANQDELFLEVEQLCPIVLEWPVGADPPDVGVALDARGNEIEPSKSQWGVFVEQSRLEFSRPRTGAAEFDESELWVPESATTLVLRRRGTEILRLALAPTPGKKQRIRP